MLMQATGQTKGVVLCIGWESGSVALQINQSIANAVKKERSPCPIFSQYLSPFIHISGGMTIPPNTSGRTSEAIIMLWHLHHLDAKWISQ
jgi:hypothetical protein